MMNTSIKNLLITSSNTFELLPPMEHFQYDLKSDTMETALDRLVSILLDEAYSVVYIDGDLHKRNKGDSAFTVYGEEDEYHNNESSCILWKKYDPEYHNTVPCNELKDKLREEIEEAQTILVNEHYIEPDKALKIAYEKIKYIKI